LVEPLKNSSDLDFLAKGKGAFRKEDVSLNKSNKRMMYVISPAFPQMNTTYNVSDSQLKIIEDHLTEAFKTVRLIALGELDWDDLFLSYPFFHDFDSFLEIEVLSKDEASFYKWKGLIQARLRYLLLNFEQEIEEKVTFQLWPQEFNVFLVAQPEYKYACYYYIGLKSFSYQMEILSLTNIMKQWKKSVYEQWDGESRDNQVYFFSRKRNDLDTFVYTPQPKGFIKFEGTREIFPQEKEPGNLLSKLISDNGMYGQQGLSFMLGSLPSASPQLPQLLSFPQFSQPQQTSNEYFTGEQTSASKSLPGPN
jgi:poly(A) polymerase